MEVLFIKVLVDVWVLFAKGDSPINIIKGTLRLVTAALMVVPTIKTLSAKNHKEKLSMVGDCFFMFSSWWLLHSWVLHQIYVGDCSFSGGKLLHLSKIKQHNFEFFFQHVKNISELFVHVMVELESTHRHLSKTFFDFAYILI